MHIRATRWQHCYAHGNGLLQNNYSLKKNRDLGKDNNTTAISHSFLLVTDYSIFLIIFWKFN